MGIRYPSLHVWAWAMIVKSLYNEQLQVTKLLTFGQALANKCLSPRQLALAAPNKFCK